MPPAPAADLKIPCPTPQILQTEVDVLAAVLEPPEREDTWEKFERAIVRFAGVTRGGGYKHIDVYVRGIGNKGIGLRIVDCMLSDRGRLSGVTTDLLQTFAPRLATNFYPLASVYMPALIRLLARPNKVYLKRAEKCLATIITNCPLPPLVSHLRVGLDDKSDPCRRASASGIERAVSEWDRSIWTERDIEVLEVSVKKMATDRDAEVRKIAKRVWVLFTQTWPERVDDFSAPLTPTIRRYLDIPTLDGQPKPKAAGRPPPARPIASTAASTLTAGPSRPHDQTGPQRTKPVRTEPLSAETLSVSQYPAHVATAATSGHVLAPGPSRSRIAPGHNRSDLLDKERGDRDRSLSRSTSHQVLSTVSSTSSLTSSVSDARHNALSSKPSRPLAASIGSVHPDINDPSHAPIIAQQTRKLGPPARIVRPPPQEDTLSVGGPERRGQAGVGLSKRPMLGPAQRRVVTAPGAYISIALPTEPVVVPLAPVVDTVAPVVDTVAPVVDAVAPVVDAVAPVVDAVATVVDTVAPVVDTVATVVDTVAPAVDTVAPVVDTVAPIVDPVAPVVITDSTGVLTDILVDLSDVPVALVDVSAAPVVVTHTAPQATRPSAPPLAPVRSVAAPPPAPVRSAAAPPPAPARSAAAPRLPSATSTARSGTGTTMRSVSASTAASRARAQANATSSAHVVLPPPKHERIRLKPPAKSFVPSRNSGSNAVSGAAKGRGVPTKLTGRVKVKPENIPIPPSPEQLVNPDAALDMARQVALPPSPSPVRQTNVPFDVGTLVSHLTVIVPEASPVSLLEVGPDEDALVAISFNNVDDKEHTEQGCIVVDDLIDFSVSSDTLDPEPIQVNTELPTSAVRQDISTPSKSAQTLLAKISNGLLTSPDERRVALTPRDANLTVKRSAVIDDYFDTLDGLM